MRGGASDILNNLYSQFCFKPLPIWRRWASSEALGPWPHLLPCAISTDTLSCSCCCLCCFESPLWTTPRSSVVTFSFIVAPTFLLGRGKSLNHFFPPHSRSFHSPTVFSGTTGPGHQSSCRLNHSEKVTLAFSLQITLSRPHGLAFSCVNINLLVSSNICTTTTRKRTF